MILRHYPSPLSDCFGFLSPPPSFFLKTILTVRVGWTYNPAIDGAAADERRARTRLQMSLVWFCWLRSQGDEFSPKGVEVFGLISYGCRSCCLTIESEERETWTADVPAESEAFSEGLARMRNIPTVTYF
jgi:hypothetical protein